MNPSCFFGTGAGGKGEEHRRKAKTTTKWLQLKQDDRRETRLQGRNNSDVLHKQMKHATCVDAPNQYHFVLWHDIYTFGAINDQQLSCFLSNNRLWHWHLIGSCSFDCLYCYHKCYPMNAVNTRFRQCHQGLLTGLNRITLLPARQQRAWEQVSVRWRGRRCYGCYGGSTIDKLAAILRQFEASIA